MAQSIERIASKPTITEMNRTLNLSSIMDNIQKYSKGQCVYSDPWTTDNLKFNFMVYPKGSNNSPNTRETDVSIFLLITGGNTAQNKTRKVQITMKYDEKASRFGKLSRTFMQQVHKFATGRGYVNAISHVQAKRTPNIDFNIKLYHNPSYIQVPAQTFEYQLQIVHLMSKVYGDITLVVKLIDSNQNDSNQNELDNLNGPPLKKRKLNAKFQCEVCDKEFDGAKGLKSHQSNKRDDAHKKYKSNHNNQNDSGLDENDIEIKFSSVILRSTSNVFNRMLSVNMREKKEKRIEICAQTVKDVEDLLYFMCTNNLRKDSNALNMIELAKFYDMGRLFWQSVDKSIKDVSVMNFVNTITIFDKYEIAKGYTVLAEFAKQNAEKLKKVDKFEKIPHSFKCMVLNIDND